MINPYCFDHRGKYQRFGSWGVGPWKVGSRKVGPWTVGPCTVRPWTVGLKTVGQALGPPWVPRSNTSGQNTLEPKELSTLESHCKLCKLVRRLSKGQKTWIGFSCQRFIYLGDRKAPHQLYHILNILHLLKLSRGRSKKLLHVFFHCR